MVRPAAKRSGLGSKQEAAGSNVFGGSDKDVTEQEIVSNVNVLNFVTLSDPTPLLEYYVPLVIRGCLGDTAPNLYVPLIKGAVRYAGETPGQPHF